MASSSGVKSDAFANSNAANNNAATLQTQLNPLYSNLATGNVGFTPQQKANMLTAGAQGLGGGVAAATGQNALYAARTGNIGGDAVALDDAARQAGIQQSNVNLGVQNADAQEAEKNRQIGLSGLNGLYDTNQQAGYNYLNLANNAKPTFWQNFGSEAASDLLGAVTGQPAQKRLFGG